MPAKPDVNLNCPELQIPVANGCEFEGGFLVVLNPVPKFKQQFSKMGLLRSGHGVLGLEDVHTNVWCIFPALPVTGLRAGPIARPGPTRSMIERANCIVMMPRLIMIGTVVCIACGASARSFAREKTALAMTQLVGAGFLLVVMFAHVCEAFGFIPSLGWGRPSTVGHYIDFISAVAGSILLPLGYFGRWIIRRRILN